MGRGCPTLGPGRTRPTRRKARSRVPAPCVAVVAVLIAFCLSGCTLPGTVRPSVKIGLVAPFEGRYRYIGYDVIYGARLAIREANASGGVAGYNVELVAYDDGADPESAEAQARKLAIDSDVLGVVGHFHERTAAALDTYAKAGLALVAPAVLEHNLTSGPATVFRMGPPADTLADALLNRVAALGEHRTALFTAGGPLGQALQRAAHRRGTQLGPIVQASDAGWLALLLEPEADVLICDADPVTAGEVAAELRNAGWQGTLVGGPDLTPADFAAVAAKSARAICATPWPLPEELTVGRDFASAYREVSNGVPPGRLALPAYEATWILIEALRRDLQRRAAPTREGVALALQDTERIGLLGTVTFDAGRSWGTAPIYPCEVLPPTSDS